MQAIDENLPLPFVKIKQDGTILSFSKTAYKEFNLLKGNLYSLVDGESMAKLQRAIHAEESGTGVEIHVKSSRSDLSLYEVFISIDENEHANLLFRCKDNDTSILMERLLSLQTRLNDTDFELLEKKEQLERALRRLDVLSGPFIPLSEKIGYIPIFGDIAEEKLRVISESCLQNISEGDFETILVDLTASGSIEEAGVRRLIDFLKTIEIITGEKARLIGVKPNAAEALSRNGIQDYVLTASSLKKILWQYFYEHSLS
ncbi:Stressosome protein rsbRB [Cytobacillus gottheilii]|uniref:Stressosome protein rsbRB n=1 Tax=Cytobacillus gottheilii TaxID=859144 RepID=UPI00249595D3|nr:Stressosome protein rsbRB [Cytobacillus gottheilii]